MASSAMKFSFFLLLLTVISSLHTTNARDSQYFNKVSRTPTTEPLNNQPQEDSPDFLPDNEKTYGLYSHESGQLPPATTLTSEPTTTTHETKIPLNKHLPKNYNPVSYVTEPEGYTESTPTTENPNYSTNPTNFYDSTQNNYNGQTEEDSEYRNYPSSTTGNTNSGGSSFNSQPQGLSNTRLNRGSTFTNGGHVNSFRPQGMSDTRYMENGKYFYDVNNERYSSNHPYVSLRGARVRNNYFGNNGGNANYEFNNNKNSMGGYENQDEFREEGTNNMP